MPMIDVYAPTGLFPVSADRQLAEELTAALLKAEGVANPGPTHTNNTGAYIHRMPPSTVNTAAQGSARTVPGGAHMGLAHRGCRGRLGNCRHGVWERGVRSSRGEEEVSLEGGMDVRVNRREEQGHSA